MHSLGGVIVAAVIVTRDLTKVYKGAKRRVEPTKAGGKVQRVAPAALDRLNLTVEEGRIFGLVGPNGSGKTTTLKLLLDLIRPTSGTAEILGERLGSIGYKRKIGFLPEGPYFHDHLNGEEILHFYGSLFGLRGAGLRRKADELLELVGMSDRRHVRVRDCSRGMIQRIGLAQALINDPILVFLDEPTANLDPLGSRQIKDVILRLREEGRTVFLSSHLLANIEEICDDVGVLHRGRLVAMGRVQDLLYADEATVVVASGLGAEAKARLEGLAADVSLEDGTLTARVVDESRIFEVLTVVQQAGGQIVSVGKRHRRFEEAFLELTSGAPSEELAEEPAGTGGIVE
jgi:ABC-2 type transport system ATP-binding protein